MTEDHHFRVAARCELLTYLISLPLRLSRKQAKDLLRFQAVMVQHKARVRHDTDLGPNDVVTIAVGKRVRDDALERKASKLFIWMMLSSWSTNQRASFRWARNVRSRTLHIGSSMNI